MTREEAIAILDNKDTVIENPNYLFTEIGEAWDMAIEALKEERPHGEWKYEPKLRLVDETDDGAIYETEMKCFCSVCGADFGFQKVDDAFCKYCGASMVKEGEAHENFAQMV